jgi:hypothetical protein
MAKFRVGGMEGRKWIWEWGHGRRIDFLVNDEDARSICMDLGMETALEGKAKGSIWLSCHRRGAWRTFSCHPGCSWGWADRLKAG